jgi:hypothetical protein
LEGLELLALEVIPLVVLWVLVVVVVDGMAEDLELKIVLVVEVAIQTLHYVALWLTRKVFKPVPVN